MKILAHYTLTPAEALRGTRTFKRLWYAISVGSGAILILFGSFGLLTPSGERGFSLLMVFNGLVFAVLPEGVLRWARFRRGPGAYTPMDLRLDDDGLTLRTETSEGGLPWTSFEKIQRRSGFWIFQISPSQAVFVPQRALEPAVAAELETFLRERDLLKS